ncbi:MAG: hypothetical protein ABSG46_18945, partial [Candidatus Binataceae bacterium]
NSRARLRTKNLLKASHPATTHNRLNASDNRMEKSQPQIFQVSNPRALPGGGRDPDPNAD